MIEKRLTGRHVLTMFVGGFSLIIAVNVTMAVNAVKTFPGLEVANSYVASQSFDRRREEQEALGWVASATYAEGQLHVDLADSNRALIPAQLTGLIGRPTTRVADAVLVLDAAGDMDITLAPGRWRIDLESTAGAVPFTQTLLLEVPN